MKKYIELWKKTQLEGKTLICPRCGQETMKTGTNALSRRADIEICDKCGTQEGLEDMLAYMAVPQLDIKSEEYKERRLKEWWLIKTFAATEIDNISKRIKADIENKKGTEEMENEENQ